MSYKFWETKTEPNDQNVGVSNDFIQFFPFYDPQIPFTHTTKKEKNKCEDNILNAGFCKINPKTKIGQQLYSIIMILLPFLPIAALIIQNAISLSDLLNYQQEVEESRHKVNGATHLEKFISNMQRERSEVALYIFTYGKQSLGLNLSDRFKITDGALERTPWPDIKEAREKEMFKSKLRFQIRHGDFRQRISQDEEDINSILNWYNSVNSVFLNHLSTGIKTTNSSTVWKYLIAYVNLLRCIENLGIAVASEIRYYGQGKVTYDNYIQYIRHITLGDEYLEQSQNYVPYMRDLYQKIKAKDGYYSALQKSRKAVLAQTPRAANTGEALKFYQATYGYTETLRDAISDLRLRIEAIVIEELKAANKQQAFGIMILISVLIISPIIIFLVRNATITIKRFSSTITHKSNEIGLEQKKYNEILTQLLPPVFEVKEIKNGKSPPGKYESVTVLKSDVADFQTQIKEYDPIEMAILLNSIYNMFEDCIEKFKVYKIDYVNDSCLILCGADNKEKLFSCNHVTEIIKLALELLTQSSLFITPNKPKYRLKLRIGICTGPLTMGVIKRPNRVPRYQFFGDSLRIVSSLVNNAEAFMVHISETTNNFLKEIDGFRTEPYKILANLPSGQAQTYCLVEDDGGCVEPFFKVFDVRERINFNF